MAQIILPQRYLSQPQHHVEIAPEYADAEFLALFNTKEWRDLSGNHGFTTTVEPTAVIKQHGRSQQYGDVLGTFIKTSGNIPILPQFTAFAWVRPGTMGAGYKRILETSYSVNFYLGSNSAGGQYNFIVNNSSLSACVGGQQVVGQRDFVAGVYNGANAILYVNGREVARTTASAPSFVARLCIGANEGNTNSGEHWVGDIDTAGVFPRAFSEEQILSLYNDPYQLVRSQPKRIYFTPGAAATEGTGSASGASTALAVGASTVASSGSSTGTSSASGVSGSVLESVGSASGVSTASGTGASVAAASTSAAGTSTASAVGTSGTGSTGASSGTSTANASGGSTAASSGSASGVASVTGIGASVRAAIASASGTSTVSGVGDSIVPGQAVGSALGASTALAVGASIAAAVGTATGESVVTGKAPAAVVGSDSFGGGYLYVSREDHEKRKKKQRIALGLIEEEKPDIEQFEIADLTEKRQKKKILPARKQKRLEELEARNAELKKLLELEAQREEEAILKILMEL